MGEAMKVVCEKTIGGVTQLVSITTPAGNQGAYVSSLVPQGNPFWLWPTIPAGKVIGADFTGAPIASSAATSAQRAIENNAAIAEITAEPGDVLTFE